jgi:hypothetical protein
MTLKYGDLTVEIIKLLENDLGQAVKGFAEKLGKSKRIRLLKFILKGDVGGR